jgi:hypothetical protein
MNNLPTTESVLATPPLDSHDAALRDFGRRHLQAKTIALFCSFAALFGVLGFTPLLPALFGIRIGWLLLAFLCAVPAAAIAALVGRALAPRIAAAVERDHQLEPGSLGLDQYVIR